MNILIDIGHPAHVHIFRNAAHNFIRDGHKVLFTLREKEFEKELLESEGFEYKSFGKKYNSLTGKAIGLLKFDFMEWRQCLKFKPDILLSHGSPYAAQASFLYRKPHITLNDTFNMEQVRLCEPFSEAVLTGIYEHPVISKKEIHYAGYHELAYLHPKYYQPDRSILKELGVSEEDKYVLIRFIAWNATHDRGHQGISESNKISAVKELSKYAKVFISSEGKLPEALEEFRLKTKPERIFDVIAFASLVWGESRTIPSEASMLGVPSIINYDSGSYYLKDQQDNYGLCFCYSESLEDQRNALDKCLELLGRDKSDLSSEWQLKRKKLLEDHIDVTAFLTWFVEEYPKSLQIMKENPDYHYNFR